MVEFFEGKFFLCRELFLTKSSVNRVEKSIPFCDRGVFRMFISNYASCTYKNMLLQHPEALILPHLAVLLRDLKLLYHRLAVVRQVALERHII